MITCARPGPKLKAVMVCRKRGCAPLGTVSWGEDWTLILWIMYSYIDFEQLMLFQCMIHECPIECKSHQHVIMIIVLSYIVGSVLTQIIDS